jgi:uncharacterized protein YegP (UPF0339 family)
MYYEKYRDADGQWRWTLHGGNERKLANSGEGYHNEADCDHAINLVKGSSNVPVRRRP